MRLLLLSLLLMPTVGRPGAVHAQTTSRIPADPSPSYDTYLGVADSAASGTLDTVQVVFYEIESTATTPFYVAIDSPGSTDSFDANNVAGGQTTIDVLGGTGALSDPLARQLVYTGRAQAISNATLLDSQSYTTETGWNYIGPFNPSQGELLGNKYYFRIVASIDVDVNRNAFRFDISFSTNPTGGEPPGSDQFRAFAYGWSIAFLGDSNGDFAGGLDRIYDLYPFVAEGINALTYGNLIASNSDIDDGQGAGDTLISITAQKQAFDELGGGLDGVNEPVTTAGPSGQTNNTAFSGIVDNEDGGTWRIRYTDGEGVNGFPSNPADLWHWLTDTLPGATDDYTIQDRDVLLRTYSEFYDPADADSVDLQPDDGVALTSDTEQITLQVVDASGNPVPNIEKVWMSASGDGRIASINGSAVGLPAAGAYVTTDSNGLAIIEVSDSTPGTEDLGVTITMTANGSAAPGGDADESVLTTNSTTVDFVFDVDPEISSASNTTGSEGTTFGIASIDVTDIDGGSITDTGDIRIILPPSLTSLGATFNPGATESVGGTAAGKVNLGGASYEAGNTIFFLPLSAGQSFAAGEVVTIGGLEIVAPASVSGSGSLRLSFDGDQTGDVTDDKIITISDGTTTFTWDGDTNTDWTNGNNWVGGVDPSDGANIIIPAGTPNYPVVNAALTAANTRSINNLTVDGAASVNFGTFDADITGAISNDGLIVADGGQTVTLGVLNAASGTVRYTGSVGLGPPPFGTSYYNLELTAVGGNYLYQAPVTINGNLSLASNFTMSDAGANDLAIAGDFTNAGFLYPAGGATVISGTTTNNNTIANDTGLFTFAGDYGGTGTLDFAGTADIVFQGNADFTGGSTANIGAGDLFIFSGGGSQQLTSAGNNMPGIQVNSAGGTVTNFGALTIAGGGSLTLTDGTFDLNGQTAIVPGNVSFGAASATLDDGGGQIDLDGNWDNAAGGTYTASGTVRFLDDVSATSVVSGNTTFFNFVVPNPTVQPKIMQFAGGSTQTIGSGGSFTVQGTAANGVTLESVTPGTQWILDVSSAGTKTVDYATVIDSDVLGGDPAGSIVPTNTVNGGGNDIYNAAGVLPDDPGNDGANWTFSYVWDNGGVGTDWGTAGNWDPDGVPGAGDNATIPDGSTYLVTLAAPRSVADLTIAGNGDANDPVLQLNGNGLTVSGTFSNDGTLRLQGDETLTLTQDTNSGIVEYAGSGTYANVLPYGTTYWNIIFTGAGTWNPGVAQTITANNNLTFGNGDADTVTFGDNLTATATGTMALDGNLAATGTATLDLSGSPASVTANSTIGGTSTGQISLGNATLADGVTLTIGDGASATPAVLAAISGTVGGGASNITFNTTGTATVTGNVGTDLGTIAVSNGTLRFAGGGAQTIAATTVVNNALIQARGDETVTLNGNSPPLAADFDTDTGTVEYYNLAAGGLPFGSTYFNLTITGSANTAAALDVNGNLTIGGAGVIDTSTGPYDLTVGGSFSNSGNYTSGNNTTFFDATSGTVTIDSGGTAAGQDFYNVQVNDGGGGATYQLINNALLANGNLTVTTGVFDMNGLTVTVGSGAGTGNVTLTGVATIDDGGGTLNVNGNWDNSAVGTYTTTGTTRFLDGVATSTISGNTTFNNFVVPNPTVATQTLRFASGSTQTIAAGGSFNLQGTATNAVVIESTVSGTQWILDVSAAGVTKTVDYVTVSDSDLLGADPAGSITTTNSTNGGWNDTNNAGGITAADPADDGAYWILPPLTYTWTGAGGAPNDWDSQDNWDIGDGTPGDDGIPTPRDNAVIPNVANDPVKTAASGLVSVINLTISDGATLTMEGNDLTVSGTYSSGTVATSGGILRLIGSETVTINGNAPPAAVDADTDSGTIEYYGSGTYAGALPYGPNYYDVFFSGGSTWNPGAAQAINANGTATFGNNDGQTVTFGNDLTVAAAGGVVLDDDLAATGTAILNLGAFTVQVNSSVTVGGTSNGTITFGDMTLADGVTLTAADALSPGTTPAAVTFAAINGTGGGATSNVAVNSSGVVTVTGAVGTDIGTFTVTDSGGTTFQAGVTAAGVVLTDTTGTVTFQGNLNLTTGLATANQPYNVSILGGLNNIAGDTDFLNPGNVTIGDADTDDTTFAGGLATTGNASDPISVNLAGTITTTDTQMDLGAITLDANTTLNTGAAATSVMNVGAVTSGGFGLTLNSGSNAAANITVASFAGGGNITITDSGGTTFSGVVGAGTFTITASTDPVVFQGATTLSGNLLIPVGVTVTFAGGGGQTFTAAAVSNDGTIRARGDEVVTLGGNSPPGPGDFDSNSGVFIYYEDATGLPFGNEYYILQIGDGVGTDVMQLTAPLDANSNLTIAAGGTLDASGGPHDVTVGGNWDNSAGGTYSSGINITTFDYAVAAGTATVATGGTAAGQDFNTVVFTDGGAGSTYQLVGNGIRTQGALWVANGTLDLNAQNARVAGNWTVAGGATFTTNGGTVTFDASTANQSINPGGTDPNHDFENVVFASSGGFQSVLGGALLSSGNITINPGAALDAGSNDITLAGNWTNNGTAPNLSNLAAIVFNGAAQQLRPANGDSYVDITKSTDGSLTVTTNPLTVTGTLSIGTDNAIVDVQSLNFTIGTLAFATSVVDTPNATFRLTGQQATQSVTTVTSGGTVVNDANMASSPALADGFVEYYGAAGGSILLTVFPSLRIAGAGTFTVPGATTINVYRDVLMNAGTLATGAAAVVRLQRNFDAGGGGAYSAGTGRIQYFGNNDATVFGSHTFYDFYADETLEASLVVGNVGKIIFFEAGQTFSIAAGGTFQVVGTAADPPVSPGETSLMDWVPAPPYDTSYIRLVSTDITDPETTWIFNLPGTASLGVTEFVDVWFSEAIPTITTPANVIPHASPGWLNFIIVQESYTRDGDGNGQIDTIVVLVPVNLDDDFTGVDISVGGYAVDQLTTGTVAVDRVFWIELEESGSLDTDATPTWEILDPGNLRDSATGQYALTHDASALPPRPPEVPYDDADPIVAYALTVAEGSQNQIFVRFSEPVQGSGGGGAIDPGLGDVAYTGGANIISRTVVTGSVGAEVEILLNLDAPATIAEITNQDPVASTNTLVFNNIIDLTPGPFPVLSPPWPVPPPPQPVLPNGLYSRHDPAAGDPVVHLASDIGLGASGQEIYAPVFAIDETTPDPVLGGLGIINNFDGSEFLQPEDITIQSYTNPAALFLTPDIVFDTGVTSAYVSSGLWFPLVLPGLVPQPNPATATLAGAPVGVGTQLTEFSFLDTNPKNQNNTSFEFFFFDGSLYYGRLAGLSTPWYRNVRPWAFDLKELVTQRGGVTIANNVINPERGERATLNYTLDASEVVRIIVFNLAGDVIDILQSGSQDAGEYSTAWDGTNRQGRPVARGIYFIRFMAGNIDEYRKVMVVKD